jgi:hypothetical protein
LVAGADLALVPVDCQFKAVGGLRSGGGEFG